MQFPESRREIPRAGFALKHIVFLLFDGFASQKNFSGTAELGNRIEQKETFPSNMAFKKAFLASEKKNTMGSIYLSKDQLS